MHSIIFASYQLIHAKKISLTVNNNVHMCIDLCVHMYICSNSMSIFVRVNWYCHFDDDMYVNLKELYKLLSQYDPSEPHYIGRNNRGPAGVKV